jgi:hypothetical protein
MLNLTYGADEVPPFAFCEPAHASSVSRWHIRRIVTRLRLTGGIDTASLCCRVTPFASGGTGGWDLNVRITTAQLDRACRACVVLYRQEVPDV